jgi:O-antigen/teichoic acid export membrane protein
LNQTSGIKLSSILVKGSATALTVQLSTAALVFLLHLMLARWLGVREYGYYIEAMAWVAILAQFAKLGLETALLNLVPNYCAHGHWGALRGLLTFSNRAVVTASIVLPVFGWLGTTFLLHPGDGYKSLVFGLAFLTIPATALLGVHSSVVRALKRVFLSLAPDGLIRPTIVMALMAAVWLLSDRPGQASFALAFQIIAATVAWIITIVALRRLLPRQVREATPESRRSDWWRMSSPLILLTVFYLVIARTDIIMIGMLLDEESVGLYGVAVRVAEPVMFGFVAVGRIFAPMVSELYAQERFTELQNIVTMATRLMFAFALVVGAVFTFGGRLLLSAFGTAFVASYVPMIILLAGHVLANVAGSVAHIMVMTRFQKQITIVIGFSALTNIVLNVILIPNYRLEGAALATAISATAGNVVLVAYVLGKLHIDPTVFGIFGRRS